MNIEIYRQKRARFFREQTLQLESYRVICAHCRQPTFSCYCALLKPFCPPVIFAILIHPIEVARRIATGRMAHLCLQNSFLITGDDFTNCSKVNALLDNPDLHCVLLYPGSGSTDITHFQKKDRVNFTPPNKTLLIFVIDGTWNTARKTIHVSVNLQKIPRICFTPQDPSMFRVRKQPQKNCYSTIEAIHSTLELLSPETQERSRLLFVFNHMISRQLELAHSLTISPWPE